MSCPHAGNQGAVAPTPALTVGDIVQRFKNMTTTRYIAGVRQSGWPPFRRRLWHRNYYEHVIRDEPSLDQIREYIVNNPAGWHSDPENPAAPPI
jgi:REP element-mobilizing transposase RayT